MSDKVRINGTRAVGWLIDAHMDTHGTAVTVLLPNGAKVLTYAEDIERVVAFAREQDLP